MMDSKAADINCEYLGVSRSLLMENAGREVARHCADYANIAIFCGTGNNGGDGFVAARHLAGSGKKVKVFALEGKRTKENQINFNILKNLDIPLLSVRDFADCDAIAAEVNGYDLIVDALVGVGMKGELREPVKGIVGLINSARAFRLSVDVATGSSGAETVNADLVICLDEAKVENAKVVDIGMPREAKSYCGPGDVCVSLPKRAGNEHKGDFGRLLVVGGSKDFIGTPSLVAQSALRCGCDIVTIACPGYVAKRMPFDPNLIVNPLDSEDFLKKSDVPKILDMDFDAMTLGNGMGLEDETKEAVRELAKKVDKPLILDADALKLIEKRHLRQNMILTPHAREFEVLFEGVGDDNRQKLVEGYARKFECVIVLKGMVDVISYGGETRMNRSGNPAMTVGGTGDTLAGLIGGLMVQNKDSFLSACAATFLNGIAGDIAYREIGISLRATDLIEKIPAAIKFCKGFE